MKDAMYVSFTVDLNMYFNFTAYEMIGLNTAFANTF